MSKSANAGELRTPIVVCKTETIIDEEGYPIESITNVFGNNAVVRCKWVNAHGTDAYQAMTLLLREPATLTMRYSPLITPQCIIYKVGDETPYEVISIDNVESKNTWLEVKIQRREAAR